MKGLFKDEKMIAHEDEDHKKKVFLKEKENEENHNILYEVLTNLPFPFTAKKLYR